jgi:putative endonuclease
MRTTAQVIGADAEELVARRLRGLGWSILGRNVRVGRAEIDILAEDPGPPAALVAVEVRWRARRDYGLPEETVDRAKVGRLRAATLALREGASLTGIPIPLLPVRVDVVAVEPGGRVRHHRHLA